MIGVAWALSLFHPPPLQLDRPKLTLQLLPQLLALTKCEQVENEHLPLVIELEVFPPSEKVNLVKVVRVA